MRDQVGATATSNAARPFGRRVNRTSLLFCGTGRRNTAGAGIGYRSSAIVFSIAIATITATGFWKTKLQNTAGAEMPQGRGASVRPHSLHVHLLICNSLVARPADIRYCTAAVTPSHEHGSYCTLRDKLTHEWSDESRLSIPTKVSPTSRQICCPVQPKEGRASKIKNPM